MFTISKIISFLKLSLGKKIPMMEFQSLVRTIAIRKLHLPYEYLLKKMDNQLDFSYSNILHKKTFVFKGKGNGTLKPYRELTEGKQKFFEKIFLNNSADLKANIQFYTNYKVLLQKTSIIVPECLCIRKGKHFTMFIYEHMNLLKIPPGQEYEVLREKTLELYRYSIDRNYADMITFDFLLFGKDRLIKSKALSPKEFKRIKRLIGRSPICYQHLDLSENNVFLEDKVIDWDNSGFFPLGLDFGRLLLSYFIFHENDFYDSYEVKIFDYYQNLHHEISYNDFRLLTIYYFLIFYYGNAHCPEYQQIIQPFLKDFKKSLAKQLALSKN